MSGREWDSECTGGRTSEREGGIDGRQTERNWRREIPSVSVIVSCCRTLGNERAKERRREMGGRSWRRKDV